MSLLDDLLPTIREVVRVTRPGGLVAIADLTAEDGRPVSTDTNNFWTVSEVTAALTDAGCSVHHYACCEPGVGRWTDVQTIVHDEIAARYAGRAGFDGWQRDRSGIDALITSGRIAVTSMIARTPT